jgi:survival of motor neuron protein-interacting protein 1
MAEVTVSNSQEHPVPDASASATGNEKISFAAPQQQHPNQELDGKKKRLLEELESALAVTKDCVATPIPKPPNCLGFGIEVIDETALLDSIPKKINVKQSRRRTSKKIHKKTTVTAVAQPETEDLGGVSETEMKNKKYSRDEMEALRFVNVSKQRKFWKTIYAALQSAFADEYDTLVAAVPNNRQPLPFVPNKKPILTGQ